MDCFRLKSARSWWILNGFYIAMIVIFSLQVEIASEADYSLKMFKIVFVAILIIIGLILIQLRSKEIVIEGSLLYFKVPYYKLGFIYKLEKEFDMESVNEIHFRATKGPDILGITDDKGTSTFNFASSTYRERKIKRLKNYLESIGLDIRVVRS